MGRHIAAVDRCVVRDGMPTSRDSDAFCCERAPCARVVGCASPLYLGGLFGIHCPPKRPLQERGATGLTGGARSVGSPGQEHVERAPGPFRRVDQAVRRGLHQAPRDARVRCAFPLLVHAFLGWHPGARPRGRVGADPQGPAPCRREGRAFGAPQVPPASATAPALPDTQLHRSRLPTPRVRAPA